MKIVRALLLSAIALLPAVTAGCSGSGAASLGGVLGFPGATVRFLNGSPDAGSVDIAVGEPSNLIASNFPYGTATAYVGYNGKAMADIYVYQHGTRTLIGGRNQADGNFATAFVTFGAFSRNTIVLAGYVGPGSVTAIKFEEHLFHTQSGRGSVAFHDASIGLGTTAVDCGYYPTSNPAARVAIGQTFYGQYPLFMEPLPNPPTSTGIGFYVFNGQQTITPSQVDPSDSGNIMPVAGAAQNSDQNLSIFIIDCNTCLLLNYQLFGVFDPEN